MGCCGVSVKETDNRPYKKLDAKEQNQQNVQSNLNSQSINIIKNPLNQSNDIHNKRYQPPLTNENNNLNSTEQISFFSSQKKNDPQSNEIKKEKIKSVKNINILDNVKEYLPDDVTRDEIEEMVFSAIGDSVVKQQNFKSGENLTKEHVEAIVDVLYMTIVGRNNGDKNYEKILEGVKLKIGFCDVNKESVRNIMFKGQNPNDAEVEQVLEQFEGSINPKLFVIELLN